MHRMDRRRFVTRGLSGGLGLALGGCGYRSAALGADWVPPAYLYPVRVSWDRIIRTTVALRPYRESGFAVKATRFGEKTLVHNYGHGGSGLSLSWGTAHLAADLALEQPERRAAVIGCGIVGLTSARVLQRRGFQVAIYAKVLPPDTTSNKLWGDSRRTRRSSSTGRPGGTRSSAVPSRSRTASTRSWSVGDTVCDGSTGTHRRTIRIGPSDGAIGPKAKPRRSP